jgi:hypothetical protein
MHRKPKTLRLAKETLRRLDHARLGDVRGAARNDPTDIPTLRGFTCEGICITLTCLTRCEVCDTLHRCEVIG